MMNNEPLAQKVREYFLTYLQDLVRGNQISREMANEVYQNGQNYLQSIIDNLNNKYRYSQIPLDEVTVNIVSLVDNIVTSMEQQQSYQYQNQNQPVAWGMNMDNHFSNNRDIPETHFNRHNNIHINRSHGMPINHTDPINNPIDPIEGDSHMTVLEKSQELNEFETILKNELKKASCSVIPNIKTIKDGVDINFDKQLCLNLSETDNISYIKASLSRPYFEHNEVLNWFFNNEKMFFTSKSEKSISLLELKTYRYKHFLGDNNIILRTLEKVRKHYKSYTKEFISELKDNSHRAVKIVEMLIVERINRLLALYLRSSENFSIRYEIENLDEIEDLLCLDLNKHNPVTEHQSYQTVIGKIINESMSWLFGKKDFSMSLLESVDEENLLKLISTNKINMNNKLFMEHDYHSLSNDGKEKYFTELNKHNIFMIPEKVLITGYRDVKMLSRFGEQREILIANNESYFEVFLSFVMRDKLQMRPTFLAVKRKESNGFVIFSVGLSLDGDLIIRRE